jgi:outer membrane protein assembly factor BamB
MKGTVLTTLAVLGVWTCVLGEDFNQWRGPQRNGLTAGGPAFNVQWGKAGPARLWESEPNPGVLEDGCGCVSVAAGRAYAYTQWKYNVPMPTRTLTDANLRRLGWIDLQVPEAILKAADEARVSDELAKLTGRARTDWITKWAREHVTTGGDTRATFSFVVDRLNRGRQALPMDLLARLATIKGKTFPDEAAFNAWFTENQVAEEHRAAVLATVQTVIRKSWDTLLCVNVADGTTVFKRQFEGAKPLSYPWYGASSTPTVVDGRCYFCGSKNDIYCLDAVTGETVWQVNNPSGKGEVVNHSSPLVIDGKVIVAAGPLIALDASSGAVIWKQPKVGTRENSPVAWKSGDRTFVLCNVGERTATLFCVDLKDGQIVWSAPAGGRSTPAIVGDTLVVSLINGPFIGDPTKYGLVAYKLSAEKAEKLWSTEKYSGGDASPLIFDGHVYDFGGATGVCLELATGKVVWEEKTLRTGSRSPVLADGKIFTADGVGLLALRATPQKYDLLGKAKAPIAKYTSVSVCEGRLYLREERAIACYDLTRPAPTSAPATAAAIRPARG